MNKINVTLGIAIIALVLAVGGQLVGRDQPAQQPQPQKTAQQLLDELGGSTSSFWTVAATSTVTNGYTVVNGVDTYSESGSFDDATNTLKFILNPYRATSTLTVAAVDITGLSTTSLNLYVGTSTFAGLENTGLNCLMAASTAIVTCDGEIIDEANLATSTFGSIVGTGGGTVGEDGFAGGTSNAMIVGPDEYVVFFATTSPSNDDEAEGGDGISGDSNTFTGNYFVEFKKW